MVRMALSPDAEVFCTAPVCVYPLMVVFGAFTGGRSNAAEISQTFTLLPLMLWLLHPESSAGMSKSMILFTAAGELLAMLMAQRSDTPPTPSSGHPLSAAVVTTKVLVP